MPLGVSKEDYPAMKTCQGLLTGQGQGGQGEQAQLGADVDGEAVALKELSGSGESRREQLCRHGWDGELGKDQ